MKLLSPSCEKSKQGKECKKILQETLHMALPGCHERDVCFAVN